MKKCLFCKKEIEDSAIVCPYCGSSKFAGDSASANDQMPNVKTRIFSPGTKKKNKKGLVLAIVLISMFASIVIGMITSMIPCKHEYKEEVVEDATYSDSGERRFTCSKCHDIYTEEIPMLLSVEVEVLNKYTYVEEAEPTVTSYGYVMSNDYLDKKYVLMEIKIKNITDKDIKTVKGRLKIKSNTASVVTDCTFEEQIIPSGESIIVRDYGFSTKRYGVLDDYDAEKIYSTPHEELTYEFVVTDIIYAE